MRAKNISFQITAIIFLCVRNNSCKEMFLAELLALFPFFNFGLYSLVRFIDEMCSE